MTHPAAVAVAITSASSSIAPVDESALRDDVGASSSEPQTDIEVVVDGERSAQTDPHLPLGDAEPGECVICLGELDDEEDITTTECNHTFHTACVEEWLSKDGRCPTCRRQLREVVPPPTMPALPFLPHDAATRASLQNMAILMLESRRLMMLATMEAALAVPRTRWNLPKAAATGRRSAACAARRRLPPRTTSCEERTRECACAAYFAGARHVVHR
jgi:hypothetical protein